MNILNALMVAVIPSLTAGILLYLVQRLLRRMEARGEHRASWERERTLLMLKNLNAIGGITEKIAVCVKNERVNGDLEERMQEYKREKRRLEDFLREQAMR
ncbi:MAG: hypothetical protein IJC53_05225 [Clostridia bacterium]|nr:hypothetical protein [Clostridia bacterium]